MSEKSEGFEAYAAVPGLGIRRVWVFPDEGPVDPGRRLAAEIEARRWADLQRSWGPSSGRAGPEVLEDRSPPAGPGADLVESFLSIFRRKGD